MTKPSFLFVKPTSANGESRPIDQDKPPQYPYDHASWEWLLERALRRTLLPWALTKSHSRVLLYGHEDKYSMHRWGSYYNESYYVPGTTPTEYQGVGGPGSSGRKTDAYLSLDDREADLPESWNSSTGVPTYSETEVAYGIVDLEKTVAHLPFSLEWLHPDWSASALDAWSLSATTTEKTQGSAPASPDGRVWTWETTVDHIPYDIPNDVPFKCLSHMRTDDPVVTVDITNDDDKTIKVETAPTPVSAPMDKDGGSIREYCGTQVRSAIDGAAYGAGWALSEFYIRYKHDLDYSPGTGSGAYVRDRKTAESVSTIGCLVDIPDKDSGITVTYDFPNDYMEIRFVPNVGWGDEHKKQTYWHEKGFPKGLDSVISPKLEAQMTALCPKCQPAIPPAIPAFHREFPDAERLPWDYSYHNTRFGFQWMYPQNWMRYLTLACTPFDMSARLDAMTTTVHRVPALFAKIKTVTTEYDTERKDKTESSKSPLWSLYTDLEVVTVEGTSSEPIPPWTYSISGQGSCVYNSYEEESGETESDETESVESWTKSATEKTQYTWKESFESNSDFLVCLRSTTNTTLSTKTTTKTSSTDKGYFDDDPYSSERESSTGKLPDSYDPDPDDLLFPDWVLPWIETAELFASIRSSLIRGNGYDLTESDYKYEPSEGDSTFRYSGSGSGTRTHEEQRKIISLGTMNTSTGRFPAIDVAEILSKVDPDPTAPTRNIPVSSGDSVTTKKTDKNGNYTERTARVRKVNIHNYRSRSVSYYVVVKWKFDRTDPETLETESPLADLYRKLADAKKALSDKERELSDAEKALSAAQSDKVYAEAALDSAKKQRDDPEGAEDDLLKEAEAALDRANDELSDAQSKKSKAQAEYAAAESALKAAENALQSAQEAYDAAVEAGEGVEEAQADLESKYTEYYKAVEAYGEAFGKLADAEANETTARLAADAAQYYYNTLSDKIDEILQKAVDDAQAAVAEATSRVEEWEKKVDEADSAISDLKVKVAAAEQAIIDAGGTVS